MPIEMLKGPVPLPGAFLRFIGDKKVRTTEDAYLIVQANAMVVWDDIQQARHGRSYRELLEADRDCPLTADQLDEIFDPRQFLTRTGVLFERVRGLQFS